MSGGHGVGGSNPLSPIKMYFVIRREETLASGQTAGVGRGIGACCRTDTADLLLLFGYGPGCRNTKQEQNKKKMIKPKALKHGEPAGVHPPSSPGSVRNRGLSEKGLFSYLFHYKSEGAEDGRKMKSVSVAQSIAQSMRESSFLPVRLFFSFCVRMKSVFSGEEVFRIDRKKGLEF